VSKKRKKEGESAKKILIAFFNVKKRVSNKEGRWAAKNRIRGGGRGRNQN